MTHERFIRRGCGSGWLRAYLSAERGDRRKRSGDAVSGLPAADYIVGEIIEANGGQLID